VEPGEVEAALAEHPAVAQAAVIAWPPGPEHAAERRLVAYLVPRPQDGAALPPPDAAELGAFLRQRLPEAMVPASFVPLAALPLTANGKLDRRALPAPERPPAASRSKAAPRTDEERVVAAVWAGVLGTDQVGVDDNFFQLGGNSLLATRVITRLRRELGVELPLRSLFLAPTIAGIAQAVRSLRQEEARPRLVPLPRAASRRQRSALGPPREP
jgi:nonribosomal peptide synthetase DhbF